MAQSLTAIRVSRLQMADILDVNPRTIDKFSDEGMPVAERGKGGRPSSYDVKACVLWYVQRERAALVGDGTGLSPQNERALLDRKRREELELRLEVKRGELVPAADVERDFEDCANAVKARLRRVPAAVADQVIAVAANGPHAIKALLLQEIDSALLELSKRADEVAGSEPAA